MHCGQFTVNIIYVVAVAGKFNTAICCSLFFPWTKLCPHVIQPRLTSHSDLLCSPFPRGALGLRGSSTQTIRMLLLYAAFAQKRQLGLVLCPLAWPSLELLGGFWGYVQGCETLSNTAFHGIDMLKIKTSRPLYQQEIHNSSWVNWKSKCFEVEDSGPMQQERRQTHIQCFFLHIQCFQNDLWNAKVEEHTWESLLAKLILLYLPLVSVKMHSRSHTHKKSHQAPCWLGAAH